MATLLNLRDLLQHEIEDLYSAEEQIIEALPKMVDKASDRDLKAALTEHLKVTKQQKVRLDKVQQLLKKGTEENTEQKGFLERMFGGSTKCKGTEGLIKEGEKMMGEEMGSKVMDAAIIASAQKIEHYEISGYGTARAYATQLGLTEVAGLLETTLNEEYKADDALTTLALSKVNVEAQGKGSKVPKGITNGGGGFGIRKATTTERKNDKPGKGLPSSSSRTGAKSSTSKKAPAKKLSVKKGAAKKSASRKSAKKKASR